jgi:RNA polymerase sigma-70 factor, ECF subfamily
MSDDDAQDAWGLVAAAQTGDRAAFADLYTRHQPAVYRYVAARVYDSQTAEDFTSETFTRALGHIGTVRYQGRDIRAWLFTIARHVIFDDTKSARRQHEVVTGELPENVSTVDTAALVSAMADADEARAAVTRLGAHQREVVELRFFVGLSVVETAQAMHLRVGAVRALQHRAVQALGALMAAEQVGPDSPASMLLLLDEKRLAAAIHRIRVALARRYPNHYRAGPDGEIHYIGPRATGRGDR